MILLLAKLSVRNAKRSIKDYIIYLITVTLAFSFIFAFNLISNSEDVLNLSSVMDNFKYVMYFVNAFIILVVCFLINYTTKLCLVKEVMNLVLIWFWELRKNKYLECLL